jgi:SAM-dependent methyltransferase
MENGTTSLQDVPSPIDLRQMADAREWAETALSKRPCRISFFNEFSAAIASSAFPINRILELGSGPGFLAEHLLQALPLATYVALDFSAAMHQLAFNRLGAKAQQIQFLERSFRDNNWAQGLDTFDCVVTHQAVHELRHKRHAIALHSKVQQVLASDGLYLVCDHYFGEYGMKNSDLYMSVDEQRLALINAGFCDVKQLMLMGGMVLHAAIKRTQ